MLNRLPTSLFLFMAMILIGSANLPVLFTLSGWLDEFPIAFLNVVMLLIAGVMCALTGMILAIRREHSGGLAAQQSNQQTKSFILASFPLSNLLLFTGIPLLHFFICFALWQHYRGQHPHYDQAGYDCLSFQISFYLYFLISLFLAFIVVGLIGSALLAIAFLGISVYALLRILFGHQAHYPGTLSVLVSTT